MAWETEVLSISLPAGVDLSNSQYCAVSVDNNGNAVLPAAGGPVVGVLQNAPKQGQTAQIRVYGVTQMVASAAVTSGNLVEATATGQGKPVTVISANTGTGAITGGVVLGIALDTVAAAGEYSTVLLKPFGGIPGTDA
jgi:hypothetical protein